MQQQPNKFCSFHNSNRHDTSECRAKMRPTVKNAPKPLFNTKPLQKSYDKAFNPTTSKFPAFKENTDNKLNSINVLNNFFKSSVNNVPASLQLDYGSNLSYINKQFAEKINIVSEVITPIEISLADGRKLCINEAYNLKMALYDSSQLEDSLTSQFRFLQLRYYSWERFHACKQSGYFTFKPKNIHQ